MLLTCAPHQQVDATTSIKEIKKQIQRLKPWLYPERQEIRPLPRGKGFSEGQTVGELGIQDQGKIYLKVCQPSSITRSLRFESIQSIH